jgi:hypothetical protein
VKPAILLASALVIEACSSGRSSSSNQSTTAPAPLRDAPQASVAAVCEHYRILGCEGGKPTPAGVPCEVVLTNAIASGMLRLNMDCRASATSCQAVDACEAPR